MYIKCILGSEHFACFEMFHSYSESLGIGCWSLVQQIRENLPVLCSKAAQASPLSAIAANNISWFSND